MAKIKAMDKPEKRELKMATNDIHKWADEAVKDVITRCIRSLVANLEREARNLKRRLR